MMPVIKMRIVSILISVLGMLLTASSWGQATICEPCQEIKREIQSEIADAFTNSRSATKIVEKLEDISNNLAGITKKTDQFAPTRCDCQSSCNILQRNI